MKIISIDKYSQEVIVALDKNDSVLLFSEREADNQTNMDAADNAEHRTSLYSSQVLIPSMLGKATPQELAESELKGEPTMPEIDMSVENFSTSFSEVSLFCFACALLSVDPKFRNIAIANLIARMNQIEQGEVYSGMNQQFRSSEQNEPQKILDDLANRLMRGNSTVN